MQSLRRGWLIGLSFALLIGAAAIGQRTDVRTPTPPARAVSDRPTFWKGNLHTHSLWSDGDDFPEMIADWYKRNGYHFLALTDHNVLSEGDRWIDVSDKNDKAVRPYRDRFGAAWVEERPGKKGGRQVRLKPLREFRSMLEEPGKFLLVPGEEISASYEKHPVHLNGINLRDVIPPPKGASVAQTLDLTVRAVAGQQTKTGWPMAAILNHPNFGWGVRAEDMVASDELRFFEVYNGHPSVRNEGDAAHASTERIWDIVLALRLKKFRLPLVYGLATDDAHAYFEFDTKKANPGRGWVMVRANALTAESMVRGLRDGQFYASTGVTLTDFGLRDGEYRIRIRGEAGVTYTTEFIATEADASLESEPVADPEGGGQVLTRKYGPEIGKVVATVEGLAPACKLTGKELYVRARVTSSKLQPNPYAKGDREMAWLQPVRPSP